MKTGIQATVRFVTFNLVSILFISVMFGGVGEAATYFVAKTGSDGNSCTRARSSSTPKLTVNGGLACLASGDTLQVGPGIYAESIASINGSVIPNGSPDAYTTIKGNGGVYLAPTSTEPSVSAGIYFGGSSSYVEFDGIGADGRFHNSLDWPGCCGLSLDGEANSASVHHIRLLNGEFRNNKCGSMGFGNASDIEIIGNHIHGDQCNNFSHGLYVGGNVVRMLIEGNIVEGFMDYGMQFYNSYGPGPSDSIVRNNIFRYNGAAYGGSGFLIGGYNNVAYNNTVYGNYGAGIAIAYSGAYGNQVYSNEVFNNSWFGIYVGASAGASVVSDNNLYNNGYNWVGDDGYETIQSSNSSN